MLGTKTDIFAAAFASWREESASMTTVGRNDNSRDGVLERGLKEMQKQD